MTPEKHSQIIKSLAKANGFDFVGISKAEFLEKEAYRLENWLKQGLHGKMSYLENHFDKRLDPTKLVPGAKTVVSLLYNYYPKEDLFADQQLKISKYAYGQDYHNVIRVKLKELMLGLENEIGKVEGRVFVDSAPVMERAWAERSGVGWIGKHGLLINKNQGSFFFLAELIIDLECQPDGPIADYCGTCTKCIDACPTEAILPEKTLDSAKCISYLTIELRDEIPSEFSTKMDNWIYGCDVCQDVCPWNRFSKNHKEEQFEASNELINMDWKDWKELSQEAFSRLFKGSAVKRTKFAGLKRNIDFISEQKKD